MRRSACPEPRSLGTRPGSRWPPPSTPSRWSGFCTWRRASGHGSAIFQPRCHQSPRIEGPCNISWNISRPIGVAEGHSRAVAPPMTEHLDLPVAGRHPVTARRQAAADNAGSARDVEQRARMGHQAQRPPPPPLRPAPAHLWWRRCGRPRPGSPRASRLPQPCSGSIGPTALAAVTVPCTSRTSTPAFTPASPASTVKVCGPLIGETNR